MKDYNFKPLISNTYIENNMSTLQIMMNNFENNKLICSGIMCNSNCFLLFLCEKKDNEGSVFDSEKLIYATIKERISEYQSDKNRKKL